jgi:hypothetical protein
MCKSPRFADRFSPIDGKPVRKQVDSGRPSISSIVSGRRASPIE